MKGTDKLLLLSKANGYKLDELDLSIWTKGKLKQQYLAKKNGVDLSHVDPLQWTSYELKKYRESLEIVAGNDSRNIIMQFRDKVRAKYPKGSPLFMKHQVENESDYIVASKSDVIKYTVSKRYPKAVMYAIILLYVCGGVGFSIFKSVAIVLNIDLLAYVFHYLSQETSLSAAAILVYSLLMSIIKVSLMSSYSLFANLRAVDNEFLNIASEVTGLTTFYKKVN